MEFYTIDNGVIEHLWTDITGWRLRQLRMLSFLYAT
jgi:hypothetical protein